MKTLTNSFFKLSILATILLAVLTVQYIQAAPWSGPPAGTAPQNNVDAPIHEGTDAQVKNGPLSVDGLTSFSNTNSFIGAGSQEFHIKPGFKGDVQTVGYTTIGTTSPSTLYTPKDLEVGGQVRASEYCDENGANCSGSASGGGAVTKDVFECSFPSSVGDSTKSCSIDGTWDFCMLTETKAWERTDIDGFGCAVWENSDGTWRMNVMGSDADWVRCKAMCIKL